MFVLNHTNVGACSMGFDSKLKMYNANTGAHIANIYMPLEREAIIIDKAGYYLSQKSSLDALLFLATTTTHILTNNLMLSLTGRILY